MMYKVLAAVAIAAFQLSSAAACGWLDEKCCNIPEGRPNDGECLDDRTVCWEEKCEMCGVNSKKGCDTKPYCEEGFLLNEAGWCGTDPNAVVVFECGGGCAHGESCSPHNGICEACGKNGQLVCDEGNACEDGHEAKDDGYCHVVSDGNPPDFSCGNGCPNGEACNANNGNCESCGKNGLIACDGGECETGSSENGEGYCSVDPHCGWFNEQCCTDDKCFEGVCEDDTCVEVDDSPCGDLDWPCCNEAQRLYLGTDDDCSKTANGVCCDGTCKEDTCEEVSHCGWLNEKCCAGDDCSEGVCDDGTCVEVDDSPCGDLDWPCCNKAQRLYLGTDDDCSKTANGVCCDGTCKEDTCDDGKEGDGKNGKEGKGGRKRMRFM